jgi:hypothetical protein
LKTSNPDGKIRSATVNQLFFKFVFIKHV